MKTFIYDLLPVSSVRFLLITIFRKVSAETGQKGLILSQKRVTLNRRNFSLPAPKLSALFVKRQEIGRSFFLIAQFFHERFFCAHKNTVETLYLCKPFPVISIQLVLLLRNTQLSLTVSGLGLN